MHRIVIDEPYEFVAPYRGTFWSWFFRPFLRRHLKNSGGITSWECRGTDKLKASLAAGHGTLLCPNHCRPSDPMAMGIINLEAGCHTYSLASWHVFKQNRLQAFIANRLGAFSIYREGLDRVALNAAIDIVSTAERPLIIFPEGIISRSNGQLQALMDGVGFIARSAAKKRARTSTSGKVVVHPVALQYVFKGNLQEAISPVLDSIEERLSWRPMKHEDYRARIKRIGHALLGLKEIEHFGCTQKGEIYDRLERLIDDTLVHIEEEWVNGRQTGAVVHRVKNLRSAILPDMISGNLSEEETERRWHQLTRAYYAQQMSLYPRDYINGDCAPERILETVERFEEDLTDVATVHTPIHLILEIGDAIEVETKRPRDVADPLMTQLQERLEHMIANLADEVAATRAANT